jgi:excisionase family DNA binding protein
MRRAEPETENIKRVSSEGHSPMHGAFGDTDKASEFLSLRRGRVLAPTNLYEIPAHPLGDWSVTLEPLLDDKQAAQFLGGIHHKTIQRMARNGEVPAYRVGRFWRYRASELNDWLRLHSTGRIARVVSRKEKP